MVKPPTKNAATLSTLHVTSRAPNFCGLPNHPISRNPHEKGHSRSISSLSATPHSSPDMASLAPYVLKRPWLTKMLTPAANWYASASGYRQLGLRYEIELF